MHVIFFTKVINQGAFILIAMSGYRAGIKCYYVWLLVFFSPTYHISLASNSKFLSFICFVNYIGSSTVAQILRCSFEREVRFGAVNNRGSSDSALYVVHPKSKGKK